MKISCTRTVRKNTLTHKEYGIQSKIAKLLLEDLRHIIYWMIMIIILS